MPRFNIETQEKEKPIILLAGEDNPLISLFIDAHGKDFKIAQISNSQNPKVLSEEKGEDYYRIRTDSAHLIKNLEEKVDYALIFLAGINDRKFIPHIFEKIEEDQTKTIVITNIKEVENFYDIILEYKKIPSVYFLFQGELYSEKKNIVPESQASEIIQEAIKNKSITLSGNDLSPIFPIYIGDALEGLSQILFGPQRKQKFYYLFYRHPQTYISAIHIIRRVEPDLEIEYRETEDFQRPEESFEQIEQALQSKIVITPSYLDKYFIGFEKSLHFFLGQTFELAEKPREIEIPKKVILKTSDLKFLIFATTAAFALFFALNILLLGGAAVNLKASVKAFKDNDFKSVSRNIKTAKLFLDVAEPSVNVFSKIEEIPGGENFLATFEAAKSSINLLSLASSDFDLFQKQALKIDLETLNKLTSDARHLYFEAEKIRTSEPNETINELITPDLSKVISFLEIMPQVLGFNSEKNYLLLFQNNGELRPTGGFIGSIGELKISGGEIEDIKIQDVYEYDGKLKAHVEPHYIIRRNLQPHLYLRDSNFDLDFQESASKSALLYNLETGKKVDGVIALNFEVVKRLIEEIGPIKLNSYNKTLDKNNAFDFLQKTIDNNFFPGSTAKRDVLQALFDQLTLTIEKDQNNLIKVARLLPKLMNEKNILFAFKENSLQRIFSANGYAGEYNDDRKQGKNLLLDFLSINEANIGVNKANIDIERITSYEVELVGEEVGSKIIHALTNNGDKNYKAYIRATLAFGSVLKSIKINGEEQKIVPAVTDFRVYEKKNFKPEEGLEVDRSIEDGREVLGFVLDTPQNSERKIEITYINGQKIPDSTTIKYSLLFIKQPGTPAYPFEIKMIYGDDYSPKKIENATLKKNLILISKTVAGDETFELELIKR